MCYVHMLVELATPIIDLPHEMQESFELLQATSPNGELSQIAWHNFTQGKSGPLLKFQSTNWSVFQVYPRVPDGLSKDAIVDLSFF